MKSRNFFSNLILQAYASSYRNEHHNNTHSNSCDGDFYNRRRNTTFILFRSNNAFSNKKLVTHSRNMNNYFLKNTVFLWLFICFSCVNHANQKTTTNQSQQNTIRSEERRVG